MILSLLFLLCNHGNLTLKLHTNIRKNCSVNKGSFFTSRFKIRSLPRMINKEMLTQFIYKPTYSTAKLFTMKIIIL